MKKIYIAIAVVFVVVAAIVVFYKNSGNGSIANAPVPETRLPAVSGEGQPAFPPANTAPEPQSPAKSFQSQPQVAAKSVTVTYSDSGFSPSTAVVNKGDTVVFKNQSSAPVRVASNPHPLHNGYPTSGGCVASTFDSCADINPGGSWSFVFTIAGSWGYHNHLNPGEGGTVVVE